METKEKRRSTAERRTADRTKPADRARSAERTRTADRAKASERTKPADRTRTADRAKTAERTKPADRTRTAERTRPADRAKSTERTRPVDRAKSTERTRPANRPRSESKAEPKSALKTAPKTERKTAPTERRRKTGAATIPDREERRRRVQRSREAKAGTPGKAQRVVRPPREDIPRIVYTPPKPMRRGRFLWKLVSMAAVVAAVFMGLSVFFRVETITVAGADKYTPWMIRQAAGVQTGDPLLSIGEARVASRIITELPYIDEVKVGVRLPGTVEIQVTELQVTYAVQDEAGSWWLISSAGRAVEQAAADKAQSYTRIGGVTIRTPQQGEQVRALADRITDPTDPAAVSEDQAGPDERLDALIMVMTALEENRIIGKVARIDVTDPGDIRLEYPQLLTVRLGDTRRMDYKIGYLAAAVGQLSRNQSGELDLTLQYSEDAVFTPAR